MEMNSEMGAYIDVNDAVTRIGGNVSLYKKLLGRFVEGAHFDEIADSLRKGNNEEALRQVHSLKGVSANLSLIKIHSISIILEQLLKDGADYSSCIDELEQAFLVTTGMISDIVAA